MNRVVKIFLYIVFFFAALLFFLYMRFPSETVKTRITESLAQYQPDVGILTQTVSPSFPPGLTLKPLYVQYEDRPVLSADAFRITPDLFSLFGNNKSVSFFAPLGNGELHGRAIFDQDAKRPQTTATVSLKTVSLDAFDVLKQLPAFHPSGDLTAHVDYDSRQGAGGSAKINLDITPARITFEPPIMGLEQLEFSSIQADMTLTPRMLQIRRCEGSGPHMEARISGSMIFREPMASSRVNLSCTLKPQPAFIADHKSDMIGGLLGSESAQKRGIILRISGTLENPAYTIR